MNHLPRLLLFVALLAGPTSARSANVEPTGIRGHMEFLADDLLEGREAGTRGYDLAALYVAAEYRKLGLQPTGTQGFLQPVRLRRSIVVPGSVRLNISTSAAPFTDNDHVVAYPSYTSESQHVSGKLIFAGHGVVAPQFGRDDYAGLNVRGRIVVVLGGPPVGLPSEAAAHLASPANKASWAAERGALGVIVIATPAFERKIGFELLRKVSRLPRAEWYDPKLSPQPGGGTGALAFVDETVASALFDGASRSYAEVLRESSRGAVKGFALKPTADFSKSSRLSDIWSSNVAAMLPGSDNGLKHEIIVVTAHLDHVGIGTPVAGDGIYNGAIDNASGVAAMLEMARTLRDDAPKRSVLFVAVTAEEKGLIGSDYFSRNPTVDADRLRAAINLDGVMAFYDFKSIVGYGAGSSTLREPLQCALTSMGLTLMPDPFPETSIFTQSDHYSFVKRGIPALFLQTGDGVVPGAGSAIELMTKWDAAHLHQPSDDLSLPIDYAMFARFTELHRRLVLEAANMPTAPKWYAGDFFGDAFAAGHPKAPKTSFEAAAQIHCSVTAADIGN